MITETDEIARALDAAALRWPELADERAELIRRLIAGAEGAEAEQERKRLELKREAILANAGGLEGVWPKNWRDELWD